MKVEYSSNNSGGSWWLNDDDWFALQEAGWIVQWAKDETGHSSWVDKDGRWLGALATRATREGLTLGEAIEEWERVTGEDSADLGCSCCGTPHSFMYEGDDGQRDWWSPEYPETGTRYS